MAEVDELMALCDHHDCQCTHADTTCACLLDAMLHKARSGQINLSGVA